MHCHGIHSLDRAVVARELYSTVVDAGAWEGSERQSNGSDSQVLVRLGPDDRPEPRADEEKEKALGVCAYSPQGPAVLSTKPPEVAQNAEALLREIA